MRKQVRIVAAALMAVVGSVSCSGQLTAAVIGVGSVAFPATGEAEPVGGTVVASAATPFSVPGAFSGTLYSEVVKGDSSNTLGGLTFVYRLENDGVAGHNSIGRLSISSMAGFLIDAGFNPTSGVAPLMITRDPSGHVVGFNFLPSPLSPPAGFLAPGTSSARLILQTNSPAYIGAVASMIDGGGTSIPTFGPAVPEPSSAMLALGALVPMAVVAMRHTSCVRWRWS